MDLLPSTSVTLNFASINFFSEDSFYWESDPTIDDYYITITSSLLISTDAVGHATFSETGYR